MKNGEGEETGAKLRWSVHHPLVHDSYGSAFYGSGDTPKLALKNLIDRILWEKQLLDEKLVKINNATSGFLQTSDD